MTKNISVSDQTVSRLQALGEPFVDTFDSIISMLLDHFEGSGGILDHTAEQSVPTKSSKTVFEPGIKELDPFAPVSLTHTKVTSATFGDKELAAPSWNGLLDEAVRVAWLGSPSSVRKTVPVNMVEGRKTDQGYHFLADIGLSVQGQDANDAWQCVSHVARQLRRRVEVHFLWRNREGAAYPGERGRLVIGE